MKIMKNLDSSAEQQSHEETTVSTSAAAEKRWWWVELAKNLFQMDNANTLKK